MIKGIKTWLFLLVLSVGVVETYLRYTRSLYSETLFPSYEVMKSVRSVWKYILVYYLFFILAL